MADGNLKAMAVILLAKLLMVLDDDSVGDDEATTLCLQIVEDGLHEVHALGVEVGRDGG